MVDKLKFYTSIREQGLFNKLSQKQVDSMDAILNYWDFLGFKDTRWLAYMLATAYHETARTMLPVEEWGKGKGKRYGKKEKYSGQPYSKPNKIYYGRGYVQLTWYENYELMGRLLDIDLLCNPDLALCYDVATKIMFEGMTKGYSNFGDFTGKSLEMYFNEVEEKPVQARRIINGLDCAKEISMYYYKFKACF